MESNDTMTEGQVVELQSCGKEPVSRRKLLIVVVTTLIILGVIGIYLYSQSHSRWILVMTVISGFAFMCAAFLFDWFRKNEEKALERLYLFFLVIGGLLFCMVFTPNTVPDENYHFMSSYKYSDYILGFETNDKQITMRKNDYEFYQLFSMPRYLSKDLFGIFHEKINNSNSNIMVDAFDSFSIISNVPQMKLPSAAGIVIARLLKTSPIILFYLGRLFNFIFFVILVYLSVKITPIAKECFQIVSILPMTLHVVSSYSYDSAVIGFAMLFSALLIRAYIRKDLLERREIIELAIAAILLAPCKAIYSILLVGVFFIPSRRFSTLARSLQIKALLFGCSILGMIIIRIPSLLSMAGVGATSTVTLRKDGLEGIPYSLHDYLTQPLHMIALVVRTFEEQGDFYLITLIGGSLSHFQAEIAAPNYLIFIYLFIISLSTLVCPSDIDVLSNNQRLVCVSASCITILTIVVTFSMAWTFTSETIIAGVQGRYFLPIVPLLLVGLRGRTLILTRDIRFYLLWITMVLNLIYLTGIVSVAMTL